MTSQEKIEKLTAQLYPTGRAMKTIGWKKKLHKALAISEAAAVEAAISTLNSILPDNIYFTVDDATAWEKRLGLITNHSLSLSDRKAAILRKMNHPGTVLPRENYRFVEAQLQAANFNVYIHENRFPIGGGNYETQSLVDIYAATFGDLSQLGSGQLGDFQLGGGGDIAFATLMEQVQLNDFQLGDSQLAYRYKKYYFIANHISEITDASFNIGSNLKSTFFICGQNIGEFADVDVNRKDEFRQLILKLKPAQTVGFLLINYI